MLYLAWSKNIGVTMTFSHIHERHTRVAAVGYNAFAGLQEYLLIGVTSMSSGEKEDLLEKLNDMRSAMRLSLIDVDLEIQVYSDDGWRIRDILGHIATWDREVTKSLRAFRAGSEYFIPS